MIGKMKGLYRGFHRGWDRNVTKSGTTIRVGTAAPEPRPALPQSTAQLVVTAATQQTQAQPGPGICGTANRLKLPREESERTVSEAVSHPLCHEFLSVHGEFLSLSFLDNTCTGESSGGRVRKVQTWTDQQPL